MRCRSGPSGVLASTSAMTTDWTDFESGMTMLRGFYTLLLEGAANPILQQMFESINVRMHALRRVSIRTEGRYEVAAQEIAEMIAAIDPRDVTLAERVTREHAVNAKAAALRVVGQVLESPPGSVPDRS
jgi:DNA-binding GntR family transcriptional regulator